ncbi:hypothetical protein WG915_10825 [Corynebacterium sp. H128]|uniref:hypothetical protein n=1 Tax=unclassified Corynebacterium TaxID=2624378 RepID=UPI0030AD4C32
MDDADLQWYYSPSSGQVAQGQELSWDDRMGPYASRQEAEQALAKAAERTKAADNYDEKDDDWGVTPAWDKDK